jgi:hypothetical protein
LAPGTTDGYASHYSIIANGNITISTVPSGQTVEFSIKNNTAGGITVTMGASYKTTGAVSPAAGATIVLGFTWDGAAMREAYRSTTT